MNQVLANPNQVLDQVQQVLDQVPDGYWGGMKMILKPDEYKAARRLICKLQLANFDSCEFCPLSNVDNCCEQTTKSEKILFAFLGRRLAEDGGAEKEECRRSDSSAKSANPYPQDTEEDEYRYIDANWLEAVARGLTAGAKKHPGETWRQIPAEEHAARAMRHLNLYRAGDRKDTHLINAAMRCMMAYVTERVRGEGQA